MPGRAGMPLLVARHIGPGRGVRGVEQVGHAAQLGLRQGPRVRDGAAGPHLHGRVAVAEAGEHHGMVVGRDHQARIERRVDGDVVEHVRLRRQPGEGGLVLGAALVDGHELLVQVVEGRAGGLEPVLEDGDVRDGGVGGVQLPRRVRGEAEELVVLLRHRLHLGGAPAGRAQLRPDDGEHVRPARWRGEVRVPVGPRVSRELHTVVQAPVVPAEDLEEVRDPPELGHGRRGPVAAARGGPRNAPDRRRAAPISPGCRPSRGPGPSPDALSAAPAARAPTPRGRA
ncbi:hypothetical protein MIFL109517_05910 [Micrococcus flavus]